MKKNIVSDVIISFALMISLLIWVSLLTWTSHNPGTIGKIVGFIFGMVTGSVVIALNTYFSWKKMRRGEAVIDERITKIYHRSETLTLHILFILFTFLGMMFFALYYFGYSDGKLISYTFAFILVSMMLIRIPVYYIIKSRY